MEIRLFLDYTIKHPRVAYSHRGKTIQGSPIDESLSVLATISRPVVSFAMGSPAHDAIPVSLLAELSSRLLTGPRAYAALDYTPTDGDPALRSALLARIAAQGIRVDPLNLLITSGGMQGLDLVSKLFLEPGDLVVVESPSYANGLATLRNYGADLIHVPVDAEGLVVEAVEELVDAAGRRPRLIYTIPSFQNPSGASASLERRIALLELARRLGALVLEDDPYSELRYEGDSVPSLLELDDGQGWVVQVRTFSKIVSPGLRVGWVVAPADTIRRMVQAKQSMDTCANSIGQGLIRLMIEEGGLDRHVASLRGMYPARRDIMLASLRRLVPDRLNIRWTEPSGGMFIWLELPEGMSGDVLAAACLDRGVAVVPGSAFTLRPNEPAVRLCFSAVGDARIKSGIEALAAALRDVVARSDRPVAGV